MISRRRVVLPTPGGPTSSSERVPGDAIPCTRGRGDEVLTVGAGCCQHAECPHVRTGLHIHSIACVPCLLGGAAHVGQQV